MSDQYPIQLCRGFTDDQWRRLRPRLSDPTDHAAWQCAIDVFKRRMEERFFASVDLLVAHDARLDREVPAGSPADGSTLPSAGEAVPVVPGFAVLALCCLLAETLAGFRAKPVPIAGDQVDCTYPKGKCVKPVSPSLLLTFLRRPRFQGAFAEDEVARSFVHGIRNGIMHEAETRSWIVWREEPAGVIVGREGTRRVLNRTLFYEVLRKEYDDYIAELSDAGNTALRTRFVKKMSDIAKEC